MNEISQEKVQWGNLSVRKPLKHNVWESFYGLPININFNKPLEEIEKYIA